MPLINCNIELKLKWKKYCVLSVPGKENADANSDNIICSCSNFTSKR